MQIVTHTQEGHVKVCKIEGCDARHEAKGFCKLHYQRNKRGTSMDADKFLPKTLEQKFWSKVLVQDGCWSWLGCKLPAGYGIIGGGRKSTRNHYAHRVSYEIHMGAIPDGFVVMHTCDNPECTNPKHLLAGTSKQNSQDMVAKKRCKPPFLRGEDHGKAKLSDEDVRAIRSSNQSDVSLAALHKVSRSAIRDARSGKNWSHVE
jgi:hypothetical protein